MSKNTENVIIDAISINTPNNDTFHLSYTEGEDAVIIIENSGHDLSVYVSDLPVLFASINKLINFAEQGIDLDV